MKKQEPVLLLKHSDFKKVVDYILSVPTGTLPGSRLAETLNILDNLAVVPAHAVPVLENALRQMVPQSSIPTSVPSQEPPTPAPVDTKKPNSSATPSA